MKKFIFILIIAIIAIYFSIGIIAKNVIETQVVRQTGVPLKVGFVSVKPFSGTATISNLTIDNPKKFNHYDHAFSLAEIHGEIYLSSLFENPLHIKLLRVNKPELFVEMLAGENNLIALKKQVQRDAPPKAKQAPQQTEGEFKLMIDQLIIADTAIHMAAGVVPASNERTYVVDDIELNNVGKKTNGADIANVTGLVIAEIQKNTDDLPRRIMYSTLGDVSGKLLSLPLDVLEAAPGAILEAPGKTLDIIKESPDTLIDGVKSGADAIGGFLPFGEKKE